MIYFAHYLITAAVCLAAGWLLTADGRAHRWPRGALIVWQALSLGLVLSVTGALLSAGLAPYRRGVVVSTVAFLGRRPAPALQWWQAALAMCGLAVTAWLLVAAIRAVSTVMRTRRRHRVLLSLVGRADDAHPATVITHPAPVAYCLPGRGARGVVLSTGTIELLGHAELRAVLAHERSHLAERHHLVLLAFDMLNRALPARPAAAANTAVRTLIEMCADDRAARVHGPAPLVAALERFRTAGPGPVPPGTVAAAGDIATIDARIQRLRRAGRVPPLALRSVIIAAAVVVAATPASFFVLPW